MEKLRAGNKMAKREPHVGATLETAKLRFLFSLKVFELAKVGVVED